MILDDRLKRSNDEIAALNLRQGYEYPLKKRISELEAELLRVASCISYRWPSEAQRLRNFVENKTDITIIPPNGIVEHVGWNPIETAPMDGTEVILFYPYLTDDGFVTAGYFHVANDDYESYWYADLVNGCASPPTQWMPLPKRPQPKLSEND